MTAHLGPAVTAFVDGELDHARRDEVLVHLTHCAPCRAEVESLRQFKSVLRCTADAPAVPSDLASRLLAVTGPLVTPTRPAHPRRRSSGHARFRRTAVGGAFVVLGLGGALGLAGPAPRGPVAPVDPTSPQFVLDHGATTNEPALTDLEVVSVSRSLP